METKKHSSSHPAGTGRERTKTVRHGRWLLLIAILLMAMSTAWAQNSSAISVFTEIPTFDRGANTNWINYTYTEGPAKLVDGNTSTKYGLSSKDPWVEFHYSSPITPNGYILWTADDELGKRNPRSWTIKGKNSGDADWTTIAEVDNSNGDKLPMANNTPTTFYMSNSMAYQYYRFEATRASNGEFQLAELQFYEITGDLHDIQYAIVTGLSTIYEYTGSVIPLNYMVATIDGTELVKGTDYTESITKDGLPATVLEKGDYDLTITGKGNYSGSQTIHFVINSDQADYERALAVIKDNTYYRIFTEIDGQRYYLDLHNEPSTYLKDARHFVFKKSAGGEKWEYGFQLVSEYEGYGGKKDVFTYGDDDDYYLYLISYNSYNANTPSATQVFFLNEEGRYAIRATNLADKEIYWKYKKEIDNNKVYHRCGYSSEKCYEWYLEEDDTYGRACGAIEEYNSYRVFAEVNNQKYYVAADGTLTDSETDASSFQFLKSAGEEYDYGFRLLNEDSYFTGPAGTTDDALTPGHLNTTTSTASDIWTSQVFLLDWMGRYAIRSTNAASGESGQALYGNTYWTVNTDGSSSVAGYSFTQDYIWKIEVDSAKSIRTSHVNPYYIGTTFPLFQFELNDLEGWTVLNDEITVTYQRFKGTPWTEHYTFSSLKKHQGEGVMLYDLPFSFTEEHPEIDTEEVLWMLESCNNIFVTATIVMTLQDGQNRTKRVEAKTYLSPKYRDVSFGDYYEGVVRYHDRRPPTLTTEVMYVPRGSSSVGFEIPELGISKLSFLPYSISGGTSSQINDWLYIEQDGMYWRATINYELPLDNATTDVTFYTLVQPTRNDTVLSEKTAHVTFEYINPEDHMIYCVNGLDRFWREEPVIKDNTSNLEMIEESLKEYGINYGFAHVLPHYVMETITIYDDFYGGAEVTLSCNGDVIQKMTNYNGSFTFMPPTDGRAYDLEIYYPGFDRRYKRTYISPPLTNFHKISFYSEIFDGKIHNGQSYQACTISFVRDGKEYSLQQLAFEGCENVDAYMYAEEPVDFYVTNGETFARVSFPEWFKPLEYKYKPELKELRRLYSMESAREWADNGLASYDAARTFYPEGKWTSCGPRLILNWDEMGNNNSLVKVIDSKGEPVTNATLHFACVDNSMQRKTETGSATYVASFGGYLIDTDPDQYAELIEVVAPGYQPTLSTMYLWNYDYFSRENRNKTRRHTIVLHENEGQVGTASLETLKRFGNVKDGQMTAKLATTDLLSINPEETHDYSQNGDYETVMKTVDDEKFGEGGWSGTKYARLTGSLSYANSFDPTQLSLVGKSLNLQPVTTTLIEKNNFPSFSYNHCLFEFDLVDQIAEDVTVKVSLTDGTKTLANLPSLHNSTIDLIALSEASNIELPSGGIDLTKVDDNSRSQGVDMKDMNKAFDKFDFQFPAVLPFTVNIERDGDYFLVRAVCERNFVPGGAIMDVLDKLDNLQYFDEQYQACMDAVKAAKPADDDFFDDIPRFPSAFVGIKGFLSGIGHYNPDTKKIDINFYDGGLTMEASARASARVSFFIGGFGVSVDAKIASTMALVNRAAALGDVGGLPKIDFVLDNQARLKVCAWAEAGIDIWIAKAVAGVRGGASFDVQSRVVIPTYSDNMTDGTKTTVRAAMEAYAEARFLCFTKKKSWKIFDAQKTWLSPNDPSNPLHPGYGEGIFSFSSKNVTQSYKRLRRKVIADLGTPIISNVSGMARPTYLLGGSSVLFNNLKTASDYNDDRLQVYTSGSKSDLVNTGVSAPMYDFSAAHNSSGLEVVAFEQVKSPINAGELEAMSEETQMKTVTENTGIRVAMRQGSGAWTTYELGDPYWNNASVTPAVAVQTDGKAAVVWQQGVAKYSDDDDRYIDGTLMLSRYDGSAWSEPVEIKRLNSRSVPTDYQLTMKDDSVLVMMTLKQDVNNPAKQPSVVYVSVSPENQVRERYTQGEGSKPQMVHVGGVNLVGFLQQKEDGRDITLSTVNMRGVPTGKLSGSLGMERRMVNDFRLVVDDEAVDLDGVALLWNQNDQEVTTDENGVATTNIKNRIYASKLCSHDKELYFSTPIGIATMPDDVSLVSMDGWLDALDMKVAYCVANDDEGAAVLETPVEFTNAFDYKVDYNAYEVTDEKFVPVTITVANNGFSPISNVEVVLGDSTYNHAMTLLPRQTMEFTDRYPVTEDFNGTIDYQVTADFAQANSNSLKMRRRAAARPHRIKRNGTEMDVRQVDMALKMLSRSVDADGKTTVVAEVNNASLLPLSEGLSCKVGLYASPLATEPVGQEVTVNYSDLYDASTGKNKTKIVTLSAEKPNTSRTLYLRTMPVEDDEVLTDVRPANNVLPVALVGRYMRGDVNNDGRVDIADVTALVNIINAGGAKGVDYNLIVADMNEDSKIAQDDLQELVDLVLRSTVTPAPASQEVELLTNGACDGTFNGWEVTNGGSGWAIDPGNDGHPWWASSYAVCSLSQTVTLADKGISAEKIDAGNVTCDASADILVFWDKNGVGSTVCEVTVQMLDANGTVLGTETVVNDTGIYKEWTSFSTSFQLAEGTRQLKYVVRGQDIVHWSGQFGPCFRNLSMRVATAN